MYVTNQILLTLVEWNKHKIIHSSVWLISPKLVPRPGIKPHQSSKTAHPNIWRKPLEWLTGAVHNNHELNNIDKMNYLKGLITCNAARAISGRPMTSQSADLTQIPRHYFNNVGSEVQLHVFCDSSQLAYGAVAYLRGTTPKSETQCTFAMSRSKVASI